MFPNMLPPFGVGVGGQVIVPSFSIFVSLTLKEFRSPF